MSFVRDVIGYGTHADRPAAGHEGRLYFETDTDRLLRDDGSTWLMFTRSAPTARAYRASSIAIPNATNTPVTFDTVEYDDNVLSGDAQYDLDVHPTRLTCQVSGVYSVAVFVGFTSNATGLRYVSIKKNGDASQFLVEDGRPALSGDASEFAIGAQRKFTVGDYIELVVWQNSGGDLTLRTSNGLVSSMSWTRVA